MKHEFPLDLFFLLSDAPRTIDRKAKKSLTGSHVELFMSVTGTVLFLERHGPDNEDVNKQSNAILLMIYYNKKKQKSIKS